MKTVILKPLLLVMFVCSVAVATVNAGDYLVNQDIKIELQQGFTIEDIIQDLHDNANITVIVTTTNNVVYSLKYNPKIVDNTILLQFLENHPGVSMIYKGR